MENKDQKLILRTLETLYELQLRSVRQLLGEEEVETRSSRRRGVRRQSNVDAIITILKQENRSLHVNEIVDLLRQQFGRITDRDTISSTLSKKVKQGILIRKTGPATFGLIESENYSTDSGND